MIARSGIAPEHRRQQLRSRSSATTSIGILANLFTQGDYDDAHALLLDARDVVGAPGVRRRAVDLLVAVGRLPAEDGRPRVRQGELLHAGAGRRDAAEHRSRRAHQIAADRTGPNGIIGMTNDIDSNGYWTVDDYEALMGLAAYRYLARAGRRRERSAVGDRRVRQPARGRQRHAHRDDAALPPRLPPVLDRPAEHREPVPEPRRRELGGAVPLRPVGVGRAAVRRAGDRARRAAHRRDLRVRLRPPRRASCRPTRSAGTRRTTTRPATTRATAAAGSRARTTATRESWATSSWSTHTQSGPYSWWESASAPSTHVAVDREPPGSGRRIVAARVGHREREQGAARLARRPGRPTAR